MTDDSAGLCFCYRALGDFELALATEVTSWVGSKRLLRFEKTLQSCWYSSNTVLVRTCPSRMQEALSEERSAYTETYTVLQSLNIIGTQSVASRTKPKFHSFTDSQTLFFSKEGKWSFTWKEVFESF